MKQLSDDWYALGKNYYRRLVLYKLSLNDSQNFNDFFIAIGGSGGLIAFLQKSKSPGNALLVITTASGRPFAKTIWKDAPPVALSWSDSEELVVVQKSGYVTMLNLDGTFNRRFGFGKDAENSQIIDAKFFTYEGKTAVSAITGNSQVFVATSLGRPRILAVASELPLAGRGFDWQVVCSSSTDPNAYRGAWVLLSLDKSIHRLCVGRASKMEVPEENDLKPFGSYRRLAVSPDCQWVALYLDNGVLRVVRLVPPGGLASPDDRTALLELDLSSDTDTAGAAGAASLPVAMLWLDTSSVAMQWPNFLVIVDMAKNVCKMFYPSFIYMQAEVDGVRVLTPSSHELIQRVPLALENLGRIGASSSAASLLFAYREWAAGSGRAHEFLRPILSASESRDGGGGVGGEASGGRRMAEAVDACIRAAAHCAPATTTTANAEVQRYLLAAAHFGRGFLSLLLTRNSAVEEAEGKVNEDPLNGGKVNCSTLDSLSDLTIQTTNILRLLNSLAVEWVGMALTWSQFESLGPSVLLDRLLARKHYPLAVELVRVFQKLPSKVPSYVQVRSGGMTRILCHWVRSLPSSTSKLDASLTLRLSEVIELCGAGASSVSFAAVAEAALERGASTLAERLIEREPRVAAQVALLVRMHRFGSALARAVQAGDTDLVLAGVLQPLVQHFQQQQQHDSAAGGGEGALIALLRQHPIALALYRQYLEGGEGVGAAARGRTVASKTLAALEQEDDHALAVKRMVTEAFASKACMDAAKLTSLHRRLEEAQVAAPYFRLADRSPRALVLPRVTAASAVRWTGSSVNTTYARLVAAAAAGGAGNEAERWADQVRRDFRIPERRLAHLRLVGLALAPAPCATAAWAEIERIAFSKRPPLPLDVIVKVYLDAGRRQQARDIIAKLPLDQRIRFLILVDETQEAINLAVAERSGTLLNLIQRLVVKKDKSVAEQVGRIRAQLVSQSA